MLFDPSWLIQRFLKNIFRILTSQKFEISVSFDLTLSTGTTKATFAFNGKVLCLMLISTALSKNDARKTKASFTSLGGIASVPTGFLHLYFEVSF